MKIDEFEIFMKKHNKKIFNYLLKILRNREDAEDILQASFVAFYKKSDSILPDARVSYLYKTAYNKALNLIKNRKRDYQVIDEQKLEYQLENQIIPNKSSTYKKKIVNENMNKLNHREFSAINMKFFEKMSYKQIAYALDTTTSAVDSLLIRAKNKLKIMMANINSGNTLFD